jgi:hypothetical protein
MDRDREIIRTLAWLEEKYQNGEIDAGEYNMIYQAMGFDLKPTNGSVWDKLYFKIFGNTP